MQHEAAQNKENHDCCFTVKDHQGELGHDIPHGREVLDGYMKYPIDKGRISMKNGMIKYNNRRGDAAQAIQLVIAGCHYCGFNIDTTIVRVAT